MMPISQSRKVVLTMTIVARPSNINSHLHAAYGCLALMVVIVVWVFLTSFPTSFMPDKMPAEMRPAKLLDSNSPHISRAILTPSSRLVYQQLSKYTAPGKNGASTTPRRKRTARRLPAELVAPVQPLTIAQVIIQLG